MSKYPSKSRLKVLALERVEILFSEAKRRPEKADRYIRMARNIAMKVNLRMPREFKRKFCRHCNRYFRVGMYRVRTRKGFVVYTCFRCKKFSKYKMSFKK